MVSDGAFVPRCNLHDYGFHGHFNGEPFVTGDVLWFCDGTHLFVVGRDRHLRPVARSAFLDAVREAQAKFRIASITLEAPKLLSIRRDLPDHVRTIVARPAAHDVELFLDRTTFQETGRLRSELRRAQGQGLAARVRQGAPGPLTVEQWRLLTRHVRSFPRAAFYEVEYLVAITALATDPRSVVIEAVRGDTLCGFGLARCVGSVALFHVLATRPGMRGVSDIIYHALIRRCFDEGVEQISLGDSPTKGLFNYKRKWGPAFSLPGTYEIVWARPPARPRRHLWMSEFLRSRW